jgi:hypothetical protein
MGDRLRPGHDPDGLLGWQESQMVERCSWRTRRAFETDERHE